MSVRDLVRKGIESRANEGVTGGGSRLLRDQELDQISGGCEPPKMVFIVDHSQFSQTSNHYRDVATGHFEWEYDISCIY
ncbi:hypothetical protein [Caulobacter sp. NIBR1757]|uniref:hypothetical protein n=1 Tax=Caulobacter sp. NIBR1757 TaxID=3016000 RepID=UPI0022F13A0A|nr:hypothetical protein [Caulobacter sp. NIBR1757]WGM41078.1 hypothetical protein AMEJIAPC_04026 [Caulobacter sp. NIBR1757]